MKAGLLYNTIQHTDPGTICADTCIRLCSQDCSTVMVENKLNAHLWKGISSHWSRGSSVSMVSDYGLDDLAIEVRSPAETKDFSSSLCVYTGSGAHPASCPTGTVSPFLGVNRGRGVTLTTHSHPVPRSRMSRSYISSSAWRLMV
jgi:hypothetical protein